MPANKDYKDELLNDDIREVIAHRPHWLVRNANTLLVLVIALLLTLCWFAKVPAVSKGSYLRNVADSMEINVAVKDAKKISMQQPVTIRWQAGGNFEIKGTVATVTTSGSDSVLIKIHAEKAAVPIPVYTRINIISGRSLLSELIINL